jgi:hypothetical protein
MATVPIGASPLFNAINGSELMEKILRDVRKVFEKDERFRQHATYPNVSYKFSFLMKYEPGMVEAVNLSGNADARSKIEAQEGVIVSLRKQIADRDEHFRDIEAQAGLMISDLEKKTRDLADANEFIKKLMADKHDRDNGVDLAGVRQPVNPNPVFDLDAIANGGEILVEHESEVIEEPDRLRESGETLNPETIEIEVEGGGEAMGEAIPQMAVVGRQPTEVTNIDRSLKLPTAGTGATVSSGRPPTGVKGRPRG